MLKYFCEKTVSNPGVEMLSISIDGFGEGVSDAITTCMYKMPHLKSLILNR